MACLSSCHLPSMPSGRILLGLFCEQLSAHPAPSASSLLDTDSAWRLRRAKVRGQTAEMPAPPNEPSETILAPADASTLPWPCHPDLACFRPAHLCWLRSAMRRCLALCSSISACSARFLSSSSASRFDFRAYISLECSDGRSCVVAPAVLPGCGAQLSIPSIGAGCV